MKQNKQSFACKLCGKKFKSSVAVFGHMRCHSKRKAAVEDQACAVDEELMKQKMSNTPRKKRSGGRCRIKTTCSNNLSWCNMNTCCSSSSYVTDDVDEELLDVADALLRLSKGEFCSVDCVSDNGDDNSVKLEARILNKSVVDDDDDDDENVSKQVLVVESRINNNCGCSKSGSDSIKENCEEFGLSKTVAENLVHDQPVSDAVIQSEMYVAQSHGVLVADATCRGSNACATAPASDGTSQESDDQMLDESDVRKCGQTDQEDVSSATVPKGVEAELIAAEIGDEARGVWQVDTMIDRLSLSCESVIESKKLNGNVVVADQVYDNCTAEASETTEDKSCIKKCQKFNCGICNKSFLSHQSLGGHRVHCRRVFHTKIRAHPRARINKTDSTLGEKQGVEDGMKFGGRNSRKRWKHRCLVCFKQFPSGRALGGHMRAHFRGNIKSNEVEIAACDKENLAPSEEEKMEESDADDDKSSEAVAEERKRETDACSKASNDIQQPLKERQKALHTSGQ